MQSNDESLCTNKFFDSYKKLKLNYSNSLDLPTVHNYLNNIDNLIMNFENKINSSCENHIDNMPQEILALILSAIDIKDVFQFIYSCKKFYKLREFKPLWKLSCLFWLKDLFKEPALHLDIISELVEKAKELHITWFFFAKCMAKLGSFSHLIDENQCDFGIFDRYKNPEIKCIRIILDSDRNLKECYIGEIKDGQPNGYGIIKVVNHLEYIGQIKCSEFEGYGTLKQKSETYTGVWDQSNIKEGQCISNKDDSIFIGAFTIEKYKHVGLYICKKTGEFVIAEWVHNNKIGYGITCIQNRYFIIHWTRDKLYANDPLSLEKVQKKRNIYQLPPSLFRWIEKNLHLLPIPVGDWIKNELK